MNHYDWIKFWSDITPEKTVAIDPATGNTMSYATLNKKGCLLSSLLQNKYDFKRNDRIIVIAPNCFEYLYLFSAAQKIGLCIIPINYRLTKNEISNLIQECEAQLIIYHHEYASHIGEFNNKHELTTFFNQLDDIDSPCVFNPINIREEDPILILFTSGSSGHPKGVIYTHKMMFWNSINTQISLIINNETKTIICMPPFHTGGWNVLLTPILHVGGTLIIMEKFDSNKILEYIEMYNCQIFMGVPTMLKMMRDEIYFDSVDLTSIKYIIVGGESMPTSLIKEYHAKGVLIRQGYGMTEAGPNLTSLHENNALNKIGSIGKPNMYVSTRIVNDNLEDVSIGEPGELWLSGPIVTPGYFNDTTQSSEAFDINGWFRTGDIVRMDEDGFLYIVDRIKNMYISGGENVYPSEVERIVKTSPDVDDIIITGVPDVKWGEVGFAYIVSDLEDINSIKSFFKEHLPKYKSPKHIAFIKNLPKTESGKIDRKLLSRMAIEATS